MEWSDLLQYAGIALGGGTTVKVADSVLKYALKKKKQDTELVETRTERLEKQVADLEKKTRDLFAENAECLKKNGAMQSELMILKTKLAQLEIRSRNASIVCDDKGLITDWSSGATELFGWGKEEIVGKSVTILVPPRLRGQHDISFHKAVEERRGPSERVAAVMRESYALLKDGSELPVSIVLSGWEYEGRRFYSADIKWR